MKRAYAEEVQDLNFLRQSPPGSYHQGSAWANAAQKLGGLRPYASLIAAAAAAAVAIAEAVAVAEISAKEVEAVFETDKCRGGKVCCCD